LAVVDWSEPIVWPDVECPDVECPDVEWPEWVPVLLVPLVCATAAPPIMSALARISAFILFSHVRYDAAV
jgi:hypothetical protein